MNEEDKKAHWWKRISFLLSLALFSWFISGFFVSFSSIDMPSLYGNVALIHVKGTIMEEESSDFFGGSTGASASAITEYIKKADENPNIKAIIFEIDSGGGSAVASDEIAAVVKKTNKTTVAWIREMGASGAYWIASATDHIVANRMSVTGSIGVIASYLEFSRLLDRYNVTYQQLIAGKYKDIGSPFKKMSLDEKDMFQEQLDLIHDYFIEEVAQNRNLSIKQVEDIATGMFYLGVQAKNLGLVDELGGKEEVVSFIEKKLNITAEIAEYKPRRNFLDMLRNVFSEQSYNVGKGIGDSFAAKTEENSKIRIRA
jgi:protease-4